MIAVLTPAHEMTLPGVPESVRQFRELAREASATPYQAEAAALCVSEMVTNAIVHTWSGKPGGSVTVTIEPAARPGELRISVIDDGTHRPGTGIAEPGPQNGYGLRIVDAVAAEWGATVADGRPLTWCEIPEAAS